MALSKNSFHSSPNCVAFRYMFSSSFKPSQKAQDQWLTVSGVAEAGSEEGGQMT